MLLDKLGAAVAAYDMFAPHDRVVVAVSGGPDSVALLYGLTELSRTLALRLHVAHLDHMLRGAESAADAAYVASLAEGLGWPATIVARDVAALRRRYRRTLEEAARIARYAFLAEVVHSTGAVGVAVGHTADDQVETVVLHWLRGAGPGGLRGMRPVTVLRLRGRDGPAGDSLRVLRPLLEVTRSEVEAYCARRGLRPRGDSTNRDPRFLRNRVRRELLPQLHRYNPRFGAAVRRAAQIAAADDDFLTARVTSLWPRVASDEDGCVVFDLAQWRQLAPSMQYRLLREGVSRLQGDLLDLSAVHLDAGVAAMDGKPAGTTVLWPGGLRLVKRYSDFRLCLGAARRSALSPRGERLAVPGVSAVADGRWRVSAELVAGACRPPHDDIWSASLDLAATGPQLFVRRRRPGDRFQPLGMAQARKLQDFMVDAKVPREERDQVPVVATDDKIVWLAGLRIAEWAKVTPQTETTLRLRFARVP